MSKLRIHLGHHFFGAGNLGDDLMLGGFLEAAGREDVTLTCCIPHEPASQRLRFPRVEWLPYDDATRAGAIARCDVWLGLGDTPFQLAVGRWFLDHLHGEAAWCRQHRKPMFYLGVGVNEREVIDEPGMRVLLGQAQKIWTRDAESAAILREIAGEEKVSAGADLAHLALAKIDFKAPAPGTVGLLLNFEDPAQFQIGQIAALIEAFSPGEISWLVQETRPLPGAERTLHAQLPHAPPIRAADYAGSKTVAELVAPWGVPERLVTSRYHGALVGAWMGSRTAVFARNAKVAAGARQLGLPIADDLSELSQTPGAPTPRTLLQALVELARGACDAFFDLAAAGGRERPAPAVRRLACVLELESAPYTAFMRRMNAFATANRLRTFVNWSKIWEYPWLWSHALESIRWPGKRVVDLGSEISPMPWFLATLGAKVTLIETDPQWIPGWEILREQLQVDVDWHLVDSERLPLADAEADALTSFSVIEHQPDKRRAIDEVARVLKPGGTLAISFDICEPAMGMTFPAWNGRALTLREFDDLLWKHPAFDGGSGPGWNLEDVPEFHRWHLLSAPHHDYIVGAAVLTRRAGATEKML